MNDLDSLKRVLLGANYKSHQPNLDDPIPRATYRWMSWISRYFDARLCYPDRIPLDGPAMLVSNHALMAVDAFALMPELVRVVGRYPRALMLRSLFDVPIFGNLLQELGAVAGEREVAIDLLDRGEMVVVYPGGARDSLKGRSERYRLQWGQRRGFAHVAIATGAPVIPVAAVGPDEVFPMLTERGLFKAEWLGNATYKVPLFLPLARRVPFDFLVGEPITPPPIEAREDAGAVSEFAESVRLSLQELIEEGLRLRAP